MEKALRSPFANFHISVLAPVCILLSLHCRLVMNENCLHFRILFDHGLCVIVIIVALLVWRDFAHGRGG
jgi:heme/copper-type cytochrome/quinol oxidase subunit 4